MTPPPRAATLSPRRPAPALERPRHLELVRGRPTRGRRPPTLFVALVVITTGAALLALVFANVLLGQAGFAQSDLRRRVADKTAQVEELELEVARLEAPHRIAREAGRLGLVPANDLTVLVIDRGPSPKRGRP